MPSVCIQLLKESCLAALIVGCFQQSATIARPIISTNFGTLNSHAKYDNVPF